MSAINMVACDGCGAVAPEGYSPFCGWVRPDGHRGAPGRIDWLRLTDHGTHEGIDVCSWECLATIVAARIAEKVEAAS